MAEQTAKKKTPWYAWAVLLIVVYIVWNQYNKTHRAIDAEGCFDVKMNSWTAGGFGAVGLLDVSLTNKCERPLKDVQLKVDFSSDSGTHLGNAEHTIYEVFSPKQTKRYNRLNVGFMNTQSKRAGVTVVGFTEIK